MYTIIHVKKGWIVCDGQTKLIKFNRKSVALRTAHNAEKLLRTNEAAEFSGQGGASVSAERRTQQAPQADGSLGNILRAKKAPAPSCKCANENGSWTRIHNPN